MKEWLVSKSPINGALVAAPVSHPGVNAWAMETDRAEEARPAAVPKAKQAGEVRARWAWTEPCVWTERMLTALEDRSKRRQMVQSDR